MNPTLEVLGLLPPLNSGLHTLAQAGQEQRLIEQYFRTYAAVFAKTLYFSYVPEQLGQYTNDATLLEKVTVLPGNSAFFYAFQLPFRWSTMIRTCQVLRVFQVTGAIPAAIARWRWGIPFAVTYGYRYAQFARTEGYPRRAVMLWLLEQIGLRSANAVIVTTAALKSHVSRYVVPERIFLIPNSVDTERFRPAERLPGTRTLIFVGRLEPQKNLFMLLEAVAELRPEARLILVGDGAQREAVLAAAASRGVWLDWRGVLPHEQLPAVLQEADIFVLPSLIEGHPKALLEAMSCGLGVVGLDVTGTRDVVRHEETGLLAPATAQGLSRSIQTLLEDREMNDRLGRAARAWVEGEFSARRVMADEIRLLAQLVGGNVA